jgi:hypothetical protein
MPSCSLLGSRTRRSPFTPRRSSAIGSTSCTPAYAGRAGLRPGAPPAVAPSVLDVARDRAARVQRRAERQDAERADAGWHPSRHRRTPPCVSCRD